MRVISKSATVAVLTLLVALAWSQCLAAGGRYCNAYAEVSTDHWAYAAARDLMHSGALAGFGYPEDSFDGNRVLSRYEFSQLTARLLDRLELPWVRHFDVITDLVRSSPRDYSWEVESAARRLRYEFAPEVLALEQQIDAMSGPVIRIF